MFIAALFTIAKTWMQPNCPLPEEWVGKMWHIYTMERMGKEDVVHIYNGILPGHKRNDIMPSSATCLDLEISS